MTTATPAIQVGSLALATRASGVCDVGERGVCYEVYELGGRPGYSFLFEQGRYDGFSTEDVALFLTITGEICAAVADYQFTNVVRLSRDVAQGRVCRGLPAPAVSTASHRHGRRHQHRARLVIGARERSRAAHPQGRRRTVPPRGGLWPSAPP